MQDYFEKHNITYIDYKDADILRQFINAHGRIIKSKYNGVSPKNQRKLAKAIKNARYMGLLPYIIQ